MKRVLYALFGYRFIYIGMSTRNLGRLKIGIARNVKLRWKAIDRSMPGKQFPIFGLPVFYALWFESHLHRVMGRYRRPIEGDGGSEFFTWTHPFSWPGWIYVFIAMVWAFLLSHLLIYLLISGIWCWYADMGLWEFQQKMGTLLLDWWNSYFG